MQRYILGRLALAIPTLFGITVLIFLAMRVLPGDPVAMIASEGQGTYTLTAAELVEARHSLGLDRPLYAQYLSWMSDIARGDLGKSFWRARTTSQGHPSRCRPSSSGTGRRGGGPGPDCAGPPGVHRA